MKALAAALLAGTADAGTYVQYSWTRTAGHNCDKTNSAQYTAAAGNAHKGANAWGHDPAAGWRFCGHPGGPFLTFCENACIAMGKCNSFYLTAPLHGNTQQCCFPQKTAATAACKGQPGSAAAGARYTAVGTYWHAVPGGNCDKTNNHQYTAASGKAHHTSWGMDANAGWRWCGLSLAACQDSCLKLGGCKSVYMTPNGCCFPSKTYTPGCKGVPGGAGGHKYQVLLQSPSLHRLYDENGMEIAEDFLSRANALPIAGAALASLSVLAGAVVLAKRRWKGAADEQTRALCIEESEPVQDVE